LTAREEGDVVEGLPRVDGGRDVAFCVPSRDVGVLALLLAGVFVGDRRAADRAVRCALAAAADDVGGAIAPVRTAMTLLGLAAAREGVREEPALVLEAGSTGESSII
jgi:hypothetical protein